jgi:hypothetical protein
VLHDRIAIAGAQQPLQTLHAGVFASCLHRRLRRWATQNGAQNTSRNATVFLVRQASDRARASGPVEDPWPVRL